MGPKASVNWALIKVEAAHQLAKSEISWTAVTATEIKLDAYPVNRYLDNFFELTESLAIGTAKTTLDSFGFTESQAISVAKGIADTVAFSDTALVMLEIGRSHADSLSVSDVAVMTLDKGINESVTFSEVLSKDFETSKTDGVSISDAYSSLFTRPVTDAFSVADSFGRTVTYQRSFADAFGLDESVNVSPNWGVEKTNVFSFTESFSYEIRIGHNSVLNASALNTYTLNS